MSGKNADLRYILHSSASHYGDLDKKVDKCIYLLAVLEYLGVICRLTQDDSTDILLTYVKKWFDIFPPSSYMFRTTSHEQ